METEAPIQATTRLRRDGRWGGGRSAGRRRQKLCQNVLAARVLGVLIHEMAISDRLPRKKGRWGLV